MAGTDASGADSARQRSSTTVAQLERAQLSDLFDSVGPQAPTLDEGWQTHHLAAHLVLRESNLVGMLQATRPATGDRKVEAMVASYGFGSLVATFRSGPPKLSPFAVPFADRLLNPLEFLVHHEDVRRAAAAWEPRSLPGWVRETVWGQLRWLARASLRGSPVGVALCRTDTGQRDFAVKKLDPVDLAGDPVELALFLFKRRAVAQVDLRGQPAHVDRFAHWLDGR